MKVIYEGRECEATELDVISSDERWNEYKLEDGKVLRVKTILTGVFRLEGVKLADGTQAYQFKTSTVGRVK